MIYSLIKLFYFHYIVIDKYQRTNGILEVKLLFRDKHLFIFFVVGLKGDGVVPDSLPTINLIPTNALL